MRAVNLIATVMLATVAAACATQPDAAPSLPDPAPSASATGVRKPASAHDTNAAALQIIKESEGLRLKSYTLGGLPFIGYGHLMKTGEASTITEAQADAFLVADVKSCEKFLEANLTTPVTNNEFSALSCLCYNIGVGRLKSSTALRLVNEGDRLGAADAILLWNKAGGQVSTHLADRRAKERALFLKP